MLPEFSTWNSKKLVHDKEWYREAMNTKQRPIKAGEM
jgi:hypothetical protein